MHFQTFFRFLLGLAILAVPSTALANSYKMCFRFTADMVDGNLGAGDPNIDGEDYYRTSDNWKARGVKIRVFLNESSGSQLVYDGWAGRNTGCRTITTPQTSDEESFTALMYPQARVYKLSSDNYVYVKAEVEDVDVTNQPWVIATGPLLTGGTYYLNSDSGPVSRLMAVGDFSVYRWFQHATGFPSNENVNLWMDNDNCENDTNAKWACASKLKVWVPDVDERTNKKFLVAHEVGHFLYLAYYGVRMPWKCREDPTENEDDCLWRGNNGSSTHALNMKVPDSCALSEGFAHFFSTDVFNGHTGYAAFHYYKEEYPEYVDVEHGGSNVSNDGEDRGGVTKYMERVCDVRDGWSTELDWLRILWDYHTDDHSNSSPSSSKPDHKDIVEHIADAHDFMKSYGLTEEKYLAYDAMINSGSATPSMRTRFDKDADKNGAQHPCLDGDDDDDVFVCTIP